MSLDSLPPEILEIIFYNVLPRHESTFLGSRIPLQLLLKLARISRRTYSTYKTLEVSLLRELLHRQSPRPEVFNLALFLANKELNGYPSNLRKKPYYEHEPDPLTLSSSLPHLQKATVLHHRLYHLAYFLHTISSQHKDYHAILKYSGVYPISMLLPALYHYANYGAMVAAHELGPMYRESAEPAITSTIRTLVRWLWAELFIGLPMHVRGPGGLSMKFKGEVGGEDWEMPFEVQQGMAYANQYLCGWMDYPGRWRLVGKLMGCWEKSWEVVARAKKERRGEVFGEWWVKGRRRRRLILLRCLEAGREWLEEGEGWKWVRGTREEDGGLVWREDWEEEDDRDDEPEVQFNFPRTVRYPEPYWG